MSSRRNPLDDVARSVDEAIRSRHSVRSFLDQPVARDLVEHVLDVARYAPSGTNTQPWKVCVLAGEVKDALSADILADYEVNPEREEREYEYYPTDWYEPYLARRRACGWGLYGSLGIEPDNGEFRQHRRDPVHAELGGFLHDGIHFVAPGNALDESQPQRRFGVARHMCADREAELLLRHPRDGCREFPTAAVENGHGVPGPEAQYSADVTRLLFAQDQLLVGEQSNGTEETKSGHDWQRRSTRLTRF